MIKINDAMSETWKLERQRRDETQKPDRNRTADYKKAQGLIKQLIMGHSDLQLLKFMLTIYVHLSRAF